MDESLIKMYKSAVQARPLINQLPNGLRQHAQLFERMCLEDLQTQTRNQNLSEKDIIQAEPKQSFFKRLLPIAIEIVIPTIKKHYPTATVATVLSTITSILVAWLQR